MYDEWCYGIFLYLLFPLFHYILVSFFFFFLLTLSLYFSPHFYCLSHLDHSQECFVYIFPTLAFVLFSYFFFTFFHLFTFVPFLAGDFFSVLFYVFSYFCLILFSFSYCRNLFLSFVLFIYFIFFKQAYIYLWCMFEQMYVVSVYIYN